MQKINTGLTLANQPGNRFPDFLYLDVKGIPVQTRQQNKGLFGGLFNFQSQSEQTQAIEAIDLYLTLKFNQQWQQLVDGSFKFGLRGGKLELQLQNGIMPDYESQLNLPQISTQGSIAKPIWNFRAITSQAILNGVVDNVKLGTVKVSALPCHVRAVFTISLGDIAITDSEGLWSSEISRNKLAVLERLVFLRILEPKLTPHLSLVNLHYE